MAILSLLAKLGLDKTGFDSGLDAAGKKVGAFGSNLKSVLAGAFSAAAVLQFARSALNAAEAVGDLSERLGVGIEDAQDFALAAKLGGAETDYFATKLEKLRSFMAGGGSLAAFGIQTNDAVEAVKELAKIINETGLTAAQSVEFVEIFGRGSGKLINVLGDLRQAQAAVKFTKTDVDNAKAVSDGSTGFWKSIQAIFMGLVNYLPTGQLLAEFRPPKSGGSGNNATDVSSILAAEKAQEDATQDRKAWMGIQDRILAMEKEAKELNEKARVSKLTDQARINELKREELKLQRDINLEVPVTTDGIFREQYYVMQRDLAKMRAERAGLEGDSLKDAFTKGLVPAGVGESDSFQRIGAFTGASGQAAQLETMRRMQTDLQRLREDMITRGILVRTE